MKFIFQLRQILIFRIEYPESEGWYSKAHKGYFCDEAVSSMDIKIIFNLDIKSIYRFELAKIGHKYDPESSKTWNSPKGILVNGCPL